MNKKNTQQIISGTLWALSLLLCGYLLVSASQVSAGTIVTNSVHVSASGDGTSSASVTTIINGEVVEDWSATSTESIEYSETHTSDSSSVSSDVKTRDQLKAMIAQLEAIISFYVSLLNY